MSIGTWVIDGGAVTLGALNGLVYALLAVGLVLAYRSSKVINFAHGEVGAFAAAVFALLADRFGLPYWPGLLLALAIGAAVSAGIEVTVVRRLRDAPRVLTIVATLGAGAFLTAMAFVVNASAGAGTKYPQPTGLPSFTVGALRVTEARMGMLILGPLCLLAIAVLLRRTRYGLAIRAAAANPDSAATIGVSPRRMSTLAWAVAGALAALTAVLVIPTRGAAIGEAFGAQLLARALVAAVAARMTRFSVAIGVAIAVGVIEQIVAFNVESAGSVEAILFLLIALALAAQRRAGAREEDRGGWTVTDALPALPDWLEELWVVRNRGALLAAVLIPVGIALPLIVSPPAAFTLTIIASFAIIGLSVGLITGMLGQLTFGQFAVAGFGAALGLRASIASGQFVVGLLAAIVAGAAVSVVVGLPGIRLRGPLLAVVTLAFALASTWLFQRPAFLGGGLSPGPLRLGPLEVTTSRSYAVMAIVVLALMHVLTSNVRRSWFGRRMIALRDNEDAARTFVVPALRTKLTAYALAGGVAGVGGMLYGHAFSSVAQTDFPVAASVDVVALTVLGGVGTLFGPLLGALYIIGVPRFLPLDSAGLAASEIGWLLLVLYLPGGIAAALRPLRDRIVWAYARRVGHTAPPDDPSWLTTDAADAVDAADADVAPRTWTGAAAATTGPASLRLTGLRKHYGGIAAVDGVDLEVRAGEVLGLIGPNGAGKTTLFELISGAVRSDAGQVVLAGDDISTWTPERRAGHGLLRSFQDAAMFATMSVEETVRLALDATSERPAREVFAGRRGDAERDARVTEVLAAAGLERYRSTAVGALSTGTRRICELACLAAMRPRLLLLDEPSSGVAQREVEALGPVIRTLATQLDTTIIVIEHDIPMVRGLVDRLVVMVTGKVLVAGDPEEVLRDPRVVDAYLGRDGVALARSGTATTTETT